jgi:hypothetical protein
MKKILGFVAIALLCLPSLALAVDFSGNSFTIFRFEQQDIPGFNKKTLVPATEFLRLDADKLGSDNLSFHLYGWGRADLADHSTNEGDTDADLSYGYLEYRFPKADGQIKGGRFFVYEGVAAEQVDGVSARVDLSAGFTMSVFGGAPVKLDRDTRSKGDYIFGGRMSWRLPGILEIGASGLHEGAVKLGENGPRDDRQMVGGDIWLRPCKVVELSGHTFYNATTEGIAEHSYILAITPVKSLTINGSYNDIRFRDNFAFSNLRSLFNPDSGDKVKSYGGSVTWAIAKQFEVTGDYKRYNRDDLGNSNRYGGEIRLLLAGNKSRSGVSYHRLDVPDSMESLYPSFHEARAYTMYDSGKYIASIDGIADFYDEKIYDERTAYEVIASIGYRITPSLALSGDLSYGQNPYNSDDLRGVVRLSYDFTFASKGVKK